MIKKILFSNFIYLSVIFLSVCAEVYFSYLFNLASNNLAVIDENYQNVKLKNRELMTKITHYSSLIVLEKRAKEAGFGDFGKVIYLTKKNIFAEKNK